MIYLEEDFLTANMSDVVQAYFSAAPSTSSLRAAYSVAVRELQHAPYHVEDRDSGPTFEWDNPEMVRFLEGHKLISEDDTRGEQHVIRSEYRRQKISADARQALDFIKKTDDGLFNLIDASIATIGFLETPDKDGGSVSAAIGYLYLSPKDHWSDIFFGEMLVHESVHNLLFLADMVHGIFPDIQALSLPEAHVTSSIREVRRPFDKAFHSACVSAALIRYNDKAGDKARSEWLRARLTPTVNELGAALDLFERRKLNVTTELGEQIVHELQEFVH